MKTHAILIAGLGALLAGGCATASAQVRANGGETRFLVNTNRDGVALEGHDAVAFFDANQPVKGQARHSVKHRGATYWFSGAENKAKFEANPAAYEPAFGGYCGYAASVDRVSPVDVRFFQILDGRLVLQHNQRAWDLWNADVPRNLAKADANWPGLVQKHGRGERQLVNVDRAGLALEGHDPVAYFTEGKPTKGLAEHQANYNGAIYRFASKENRETFEKDPAKYAPAFGGFCGYAASIDKISPVDVNIFQILDGRLVLQHTQKAYRLFNEDPEKSLARADANWPGLEARRGR
jgi:YHS domain-containing protein